MSGIIIGLAGEMASGKTTVAEYLQDKYQAKVYSFSSILRDFLNIINKENSRENLQKMSTILREGFGDDILAEAMAQKADNSNDKIIAIDGVRRLGDIKQLNKIKGFKLLFLEASVEDRYKRLINRTEKSDDENKTLEEFKKDHQREAEQQIKELKQYANVVIDNNGTLEDLYRQIEELVK